MPKRQSDTFMLAEGLGGLIWINENYPDQPTGVANGVREDRIPGWWVFRRCLLYVHMFRWHKIAECTAESWRTLFEKV